MIFQYQLIQRHDRLYFYLHYNHYSKDEASKLFLDHKIDLIPIVNQKLEVIDYISWNDFFGQSKIKEQIDLPVIIMAGGKGDRLQPFTKVLPKPLIPINNKPIIEHIIENFLKFGIKNFFLSVNFKSRVLKSYFCSNHLISFFFYLFFC